MPGNVDAIPSALTGQGYSTFFVDNRHSEAGGALFLHNSSFRVRNVFFTGNGKYKTGYGGALAIRNYASEIQEIENEVFGCVAVLSVQVADGGAFAAVGYNDSDTTLSGVPINVFGNGGRCRFVENVVHANESARHGGGFYLSTGDFLLQRNRISKNKAWRNGGGMACFAHCRVQIVDNIIIGNEVTRKDFEKAPGGGAGIYATHVPKYPTHLILERNKIIGNFSTEDGGGLRATCGARIELKRGNVFKDNVAFRNGGGISLRNARLVVGPDNMFQENRTEDGGAGKHRGGDGGAVHCFGGFASQGALSLIYGPCAYGDAGLSILGDSADLVRFVGNKAVKQGGALFIRQETDNLSIFPIGELREMQIQHAEFDDNRSFGQMPTSSGPQSLIGSTIVIDGLTLWQNKTNHKFSDSFVLSNLTVRVVQGVGLYLIHSGEVDRSDNIHFDLLLGATAVQDEFIYNP